MSNSVLPIGLKLLKKTKPSRGVVWLGFAIDLYAYSKAAVVNNANVNFT